MKKWISAVIAFAMLLSLSCPVFAERLLKPIEEAAPAAVEVEDETPVIPEELVPTAAAPTVALTAAEYELGYVHMATELSAALGGALKGYDYRDKRTFGKIGDEIAASRDLLSELASAAAPAEYQEAHKLFAAAAEKTAAYYDSFTAMTRSPSKASYDKSVKASQEAQKAILAAVNQFVETYTSLHPGSQFTRIPVGA